MRRRGKLVCRKDRVSVRLGQVKARQRARQSKARAGPVSQPLVTMKEIADHNGLLVLRKRDDGS